MTVTIDGTAGITTPNEKSTGGLYAQGVNTATFTDGIAVDYTTGLGRISVGTSDGLAFYNGGVAATELMRVDSSGNLGLGVTPSGWGAGQRAIQAGNFTASGGGNGFTSNGYYNAGWKYVANGYATNIYEQSGSLIFANAPSGTAGNAISFTQAMTLDASGRMTIPNQPSACRRLTVSNTGPGLIAWDTAILNNGIAYNTSTKRFTVPIAGKYQIIFSGFVSGYTASPVRVELGVNTDTPSGSSNYGMTYSNTPNTVYTPISFAVILNLNANDYFVTYIEGSGTLYSASNDLFNYISANLIG